VRGTDSGYFSFACIGSSGVWIFGFCCHSSTLLFIFFSLTDYAYWSVPIQNYFWNNESSTYGRTPWTSVAQPFYTRGTLNIVEESWRHTNPILQGLDEWSARRKAAQDNTTKTDEDKLPCLKRDSNPRSSVRALKTSTLLKKLIIESLTALHCCRKNRACEQFLLQKLISVKFRERISRSQR
jgi:hypothetical protein